MYQPYTRQHYPNTTLVRGSFQNHTLHIHQKRLLKKKKKKQKTSKTDHIIDHSQFIKGTVILDHECFVLDCNWP